MKIFSLSVLCILERVWFFPLAYAFAPSPLSLPGEPELRPSFHACFALTALRRGAPWESSAPAGLELLHVHDSHPQHSPANSLRFSRKLAPCSATSCLFGSPLRNHTHPPPLSAVNHVLCCGESGGRQSRSTLPPHHQIHKLPAFTPASSFSLPGENEQPALLLATVDRSETIDLEVSKLLSGKCQMVNIFTFGSHTVSAVMKLCRCRVKAAVDRNEWAWQGFNKTLFTK